MCSSDLRTGTSGSTTYGGPGGAGGINGNSGGTGGAPGASGGAGSGATGGALGTAGLCIKRKLNTPFTLTNEGSGVTYGNTTATY